MNGKWQIMLILALGTFASFGFLTISAHAVSTMKAADSLKVSVVKVRLPASGMVNTGMFMKIENTDKVDHQVVKAEGTAAKTIELHDHIKEGDVYRMRAIEKMELKSGTITELKPGSLHVMLIGLVKELKLGDKVQVKLILEDGSSLNVEGPVEEIQVMKKMGH